MVDIFLWLALHLCGSDYSDVERASAHDMPTFQLVEEYTRKKTADYTECHWLVWKLELADEMVFRLAKGNGEGK